MKPVEYAHVDVFTDTVLQGNGLAVVFCGRFLDGARMLDLAREFKQFETIFVTGIEGGEVSARIFTMDGELPFAGHPLLGAAAALHERHAPGEERLSLTFRLTEKQVPVVSERTHTGFHAAMRQGVPAFLGEVPAAELGWLLRSHSLTEGDLAPGLPVEVVSTGLAYVLLPVRGCLDRARIRVRDLEARIAAYGAAYTYLFDPDTLEARTWDNLGLIEDSATGSAAGPVCAYLVRHGRLCDGERIRIRQGRYANRPGMLTAWMERGEVYVSGDVVFFAKGTFTV